MIDLAEDTATAVKLKPRKEIIPAITDAQNRFNKLTDGGIPVRSVKFHSTVTSSVDGIPEYAFYDMVCGNKRSRTVQMWMTPAGLAWQQGACFGLEPITNVYDVKLLL